jgi:hypothetical protein
MTRRVVSILLVVILISACVSAQDTSRHFKSTAECGYEFDYPAGWRAEALPADKYTSCAAQIRPVDFKKRMAKYDVDVYTLTVSVPGGGTFLDVASRSGFDFWEGKWVTRGRMGHRSSASVFQTAQWSVFAEQPTWGVIMNMEATLVFANSSEWSWRIQTRTYG